MNSGHSRLLALVVRERLRHAAALLAFAGTLFAACLVAGPASAQATGGTLNGTISDPSGAAIAKADVLIMHKGTGAVRTAVTNELGFFSTPNLAPGAYDVTVVATGFATVVQEGVTIDVGATVVTNVRMTITAVQETINVVAATADVSLASSTLSRVVKGDTVRDLPINGRDWT